MEGTAQNAASQKQAMIYICGGKKSYLYSGLVDFYPRFLINPYFTEKTFTIMAQFTVIASFSCPKNVQPCGMFVFILFFEDYHASIN
jgi:hypothetical protein